MINKFAAAKVLYIYVVPLILLQFIKYLFIPIKIYFKCQFDHYCK